MRIIVIRIIRIMMITIVLDMKIMAGMIMHSKISMMTWIQACSMTFNHVNHKGKISRMKITRNTSFFSYYL